MSERWFFFWTLVLLFGCQENGPQQQNEATAMESTSFDWQGHRGARGLAPENSIPAFLLALEFPLIQTLELDLVISKDSQVVVSHEPWLSADICRTAKGETPPEPPTEVNNIFQLNYSDIRRFDCGSVGNARFPEQNKQAVYKPLLSEVITAAEGRAADLERPLPYYNIEIKSRPDWDNTFTPSPVRFAELVLGVVTEAGVAERTVIQSFDPRSLKAVHEQAPSMTLAYLVESPVGLEAALEELGFTPAIWSPHYLMVSKNLVDSVHQKQMRIIPWTVNDAETMQGLKELGVDGIITDYPNRIPRVGVAHATEEK